MSYAVLWGNLFGILDATKGWHAPLRGLPLLICYVVEPSMDPESSVLSPHNCFAIDTVETILPYQILLLTLKGNFIFVHHLVHEIKTKRQFRRHGRPRIHFNTFLEKVGSLTVFFLFKMNQAQSVESV